MTAPRSPASSGQAAECGAGVPSNKLRMPGMEVGHVWSGIATHVGSASTADGQIFVAYYDPERFVTLAKFDAAGKQVCQVRLASQFGGWDAHNDLAVAIGPDHSLHVVGNMHATPMFYAHGDTRDLASVSVSPMTGQDEIHATYPRFFHDGNGNLLFSYRSGSSGDGMWLLNRWVGGRWQRVGSLFAAADKQGHVSAYPTPFVQSKDGSFCVAIVWRRTIDVSSNFAVTYASTRDFQTWRGIDGKTVSGPLGPDSLTPVDVPGIGAGLVNGAILALANGQQPIIAYTKYAPSGKNAIFAARVSEGRWLVKEIAESSERMEISGGGSIPNLPSANVLGTDDGQVQLKLNLQPRQQRISLDPNSLATHPMKSASSQPSESSTLPQSETDGMANVSVRSDTPLVNGVDGKAVGQFHWFAQAAHQDQPYPCTKEAPKACRPTASPLIWSPQ